MLSTAYRGDRGKTAYDHSQATGNPHNLTLAALGAAGKSSKISASIGTTWEGTAVPYTQQISVAGATATNAVEVKLPTTATMPQIEAFGALNLQDGGQAVGSITLRCWGEKNTISIPIEVIVRGDL